MSASKSIVSRSTKLYVALNFYGPCVCFHGPKIIPRRWIGHLFRTMAPLDLHLSLFCPTNERDTDRMMQPFYRWLFYHDLLHEVNNTTQVQKYMQELVNLENGNPKRIIYITSKVEHSGILPQTLTVEKSPKTKNEVRNNFYDSDDYGIVTKQSSYQAVDHREDYSPLALAEMIQDLATCPEISVAEYLQLSPTVDKVKVPILGFVNYLPLCWCTAPFKEKAKEVHPFM